MLVSGKKALADAGLAWQGDDIKVCVVMRCSIARGTGCVFGLGGGSRCSGVVPVC